MAWFASEHLQPVFVFKYVYILELDSIISRVLVMVKKISKKEGMCGGQSMYIENQTLKILMNIILFFYNTY